MSCVVYLPCAQWCVDHELCGDVDVCGHHAPHPQANELDLAIDVYQQMLAEGCTPNVVTYNTLIDVYGKTGQWEEAIAVLDTLERQVHIEGGNALSVGVNVTHSVVSWCVNNTHTHNGVVAHHSVLKGSRGIVVDVVSSYVW